MRRAMLVIGTLSVCGALAIGGASAATAAAGDSWSEVVLPAGDIPGQAVAFGNGTFVAVDRNGSIHPNSVMTSPDGESGNWTLRVAPQRRWADIAFGNGLFVAVAAPWTGSSPTPAGIFTSTDGVTWTERGASLSGSGVNFFSVTYGHGKFMAAGNGYVATSPDGLTWTQMPDVPPSFAVVDLAASQSGFVGVGQSTSGKLWFLPAGSSAWQSPALPSGHNGPNYTSVAAGQGPLANTVVAADKYGGLATSVDGGATWVQSMTPVMSSPYDAREWTAVAFGDGTFVVVQSGNSATADPAHLAVTSTDAITWHSSVTLAASRPWFALAFGQCKFVALGQTSDSGVAPGMLTRVGGSVTFDANGGTGTMAVQRACSSTGLAENAFSRSGYSFDGWATTASGPRAYAPGDLYPFTSDVRLFARWIPAPVPSTPGGGSSSSGSSGASNPTVSVPIVPVVVTPSPAPPTPPAVSPVAPSIGSARIIYRQVGSKWQPVVRRGSAGAYSYVRPRVTPSIPANALVTVVSSGDPKLKPSRNIPAAKAQAVRIATAAQARAHSGVLQGNLWRGSARIIVNW